jgi:hypothetical protein
MSGRAVTPGDAARPHTTHDRETGHDCTESVTPPAPESVFRAMLDAVQPVIGVVVVAGPPVVFLAAPWLLLVLMLSGPFALLVAFVVTGFVAAALLVTLTAIAAAPFVLARRLYRRSRESQALSVSTPQVATLHAPRVAA